MDRIYKYNPNVSYEPNGGTYLQLITAKDLYIQNITVSSACGVSVEHLNAKEPMIRSIYRFHVYYHIRRILKILEIPLPYENSFNQYNICTTMRSS